jgi:hypothetical protein
MTTAAGRAAFDIARWGLLGPAALVCALQLDAQWSADQFGWALFTLAAAGFVAGGAMAGAAIPGAGPGVAAALAATYAAGGLVATGQAFWVLSEGIDDPLTFASFLGMMLAFTVILPVVAAIAFALVPGRRLHLASRAAGSFLIGAATADLVVGLGVMLGGVLAEGGAAADSLDALMRARMLERGVTVGAITIAIEIAFVIGGTGVAHALEDRPPA